MKFFKSLRFIPLLAVMMAVSCSDEDINTSVDINQIELKSPLSNDTVSSAVKFEWESSSDVDYTYRLSVSRSDDMSSMLFSKTLKLNKFDTLISESNEYYWQVVAIENSSKLFSSEVRKLTISKSSDPVNSNLTKSFKLDFSDGVTYSPYNEHGWSNVFVKGNEAFKKREHKGNGYVESKAFQSESEQIETYFVSPELVLDSKGKTKTFKFEVARHHSKGETLQLFITSNYNESNPEASNWEELNFPVPAKQDKFGPFESKTIDLTAFESKVRIAFKYSADNSTNTGSFQLDNISFEQETPNTEQPTTPDSGGQQQGGQPANANDYYRTLSTQKPAKGAYGVQAEPTWGYVVPGYTASFYSTLNGLKGSALKAEVKRLTQVNNSKTSYSWERYEQTDEDPRNPQNVVLIYRGTSQSKNSHGGGTTNWNREHVFACSNAGFSRGAKGGGADNHHIRASNVKENSNRGSKKLGSGYMPRAAVRGDVARMSFYVALMYNVSPSRNVDLAWALKENKIDKVDDWEMHQNNVVENLQGNRNAFIDLPMLADYIFGDKQNVAFQVPVVK